MRPPFSAGAVCEQKVLVGACDRAASLSTTQNEGFKPRADVVSDLTGLFGEGLADWKMTEIGDVLHARSCHDMTLPCSHKVIYRTMLIFFSDDCYKDVSCD